jgi:hypothetical protein
MTRAGCAAALVGEQALRHRLADELRALAEDVSDCVACSYLDGYQAGADLEILEGYDPARAAAANDAGERAASALLELAEAIEPVRPTPLAAALASEVA